MLYKNLNINVSIKTLVSLVLLASILVVSVPMAQAEDATPTPVSSVSMGEMESLIKQLLEQVKVLQLQLQALQKQSGGVPATDKKPVVTDTTKEMEVEVLESIRVRSEAGVGTAQIAIQSRGQRGVIIDGPVERGGLKWYKIKYADGTVGWSAANWLRITERMKVGSDANKPYREMPKYDPKKDFPKDQKDVKEKPRNEKKPDVKDPLTRDPVACTMDAFQCPNGEFVGRTGPKCEFVCPLNSTTTTQQ